jgi:DNA-binding NarL/FixJ family response regulator
MRAITPIQIIIVDDYAQGRRGLAVALGLFDDLALTAEASTAEETVGACERLTPDVVLIDLTMADMDSVELIRVLHKRFPCIKIIALASYESQRRKRAALEAGATNHIVRDAPIDQFATLIRQVVSVKDTTLS